MRTFLKFLFAAIFVCIVTVTVRSGLAVAIWDAWPSYKANPWAVATLFDAYFGFLTFFVWVAYKESFWWKRILWFILIMSLGNIAMSAYVLIELFRLPGSEPLETVLLRRT